METGAGAVQPLGVDSRDRPRRDASSGQGPWAGVILFFLANTLFGAGLFFHAFLYNFYLQALGHDEGVMGVAAAAISAGGVLSLIPAGVAVDRWGVLKAYVGAAALAAAGLAAGAVAERPVLVYVAAAVAGAGAAAFRVSMGPALMRLAGPGIRARAFSWNTAILVGSGAAWTAAAGWLSASLMPVLGENRVEAHRTALLLGALVTVLAAALAPIALGTVSRAREGDAADRGPSTPRAVRGFRNIAIPRRLAVVILVVGVFWTAGALGLPFFNIYFQRVHAISLERIGLILSIGQVLTAVAVFASGETAARAGPGRMLLIWMFLFAPAIWALALAGNLTLAIVFYMLQAFVLPAVNPLVDQILLEEAAPGRHGAVSSWRNLAVEGSGLVGATVGGYLLQAVAFQGLFAVAGALALGAAIIAIEVLRRLAGSG